MAHKDWRSILGAIEGLPSGLPSEHVAVMARWFQLHLGQPSSSAPDDSPGLVAGPSDVPLNGLSFAEVRTRMERLGASKQMRAQEKALLCAWVWSLEGSKDFCSNDAQKLYGEDGANLNAHHFNQQAALVEEEAPPLNRAAMVRIGKGRYRLTEEGRETGRRLAEAHLFSPDEGTGAAGPCPGV